MRLSIKKTFFAGIIGFATMFSTICGVVSAEEEKNYTIATGSDPLQTLDHANYGLPILQPATPGNQQHGSIHIEDTGMFGGSVGIGLGTETTPAAALHVIGTQTALHVTGNNSAFLSNVGIGTETPATELHVLGAVTATGNMNVSGTITADSFVGDGSGLTGVTAEGAGEDTTNDSWTGIGTVTTTGKVGIGTTGPVMPLVVTDSVQDLMLIARSSGTNGDEARLNFGVAHSSFIGAYVTGIRDGGSGEMSLAFGVNNTGGNPIEKVRIDKKGNVGIGTTAPAAGHILELSSTSKAFVLPRMTKTQRNAITGQVAGMVIYQTDNTPGLRVHNGTNWMRFTETTD